MEIVVDAKVTAGPEGVAATEKEPDTGGGGGRKLTSRWIEKRLGQPLRRVSQTETTLALLLRPFLAPLFPLFSASCNTPRILPLPTLFLLSAALAFVFTFSPFSCPASQRCPPALRSVWNTFYCYRPKKRSWIRFVFYIYVCVCIYIYIGEWNRTTGGGKLVFSLFLSSPVRTLSLFDISLLDRVMPRLGELSRLGSRLEVLRTPRRRCDDRNEKSYVLRVDRSMSREYGCGCIVDTSDANVQGVGEEKEFPRL